MGRPFHNTNSTLIVDRDFSCHVMKTKSWEKFYSLFSIAKGYRDLESLVKAALAAMRQLK